MNLSNPIFDSVLQIDEELKTLQEEVQEINQRYNLQGEASEQFEVPQPHKLKVQPVSVPVPERRYENIVKLKVDKAEILPKTKMKPQISKKWVETVKIEPDIKALYSKEMYEPEYSTLDTLQIPPKAPQSKQFIYKLIDKENDYYLGHFTK